MLSFRHRKGPLPPADQRTCFLRENPEASLAHGLCSLENLLGIVPQRIVYRRPRAHARFRVQNVLKQGVGFQLLVLANQRTDPRACKDNGWTSAVRLPAPG